MTDDYTRYTWVRFLRLKNDTFQHFKDFVKLVETQFTHKVHLVTHTEHDWSNNTVANLRSDRGGEYLSAKFTSYLVQKGIQRQLTTADTPHQNGISERKNRTLMEATRCVFNSRKYPAHLWTECTRVVNYVLNRSGTRALNLTTPFEKLYGHQPNVSQLRVLGSTAYVYIPKDKRTKLGHKAFKCVLVGYDDQSKAYRLWCPTRQKVILSNDVTVFESVPCNFHFDAPFVDVFARLLDEDDDLESPASHPITQTDFTPMDNDDTGSTPPRSPPTLPDNPASPILPRRNPPRATKRLPSHFDLFDMGGSDSSDDADIVETIGPISDKISEREAQNDPQWQATRREEFDALIQNLTWELVDRPLGQHVLHSKWVYKAKSKINPTRVRLKARLVARGLEQKFGIDYNETLAPVVRRSTLRAMIALSVTLGWELNHMDVITVFLNGKLKERIYMEQPPGFVVPGHEDKVCQLNRSLYGLKQSPRQWYEEIDNHLRKSGWTCSELDPNLYFLREGDTITVLMLYVDDLLIFGSSKEKVAEIKVQLGQKYKMKDLGLVLGGCTGEKRRNYMR